MNTILKSLKTWDEQAMSFIDAHPDEIGSVCLFVGIVCFVWALTALVNNDIE